MCVCVCERERVSICVSVSPKTGKLFGSFAFLVFTFFFIFVHFSSYNLFLRFFFANKWLQSHVTALEVVYRSSSALTSDSRFKKISLGKFRYFDWLVRNMLHMTDDFPSYTCSVFGILAAVPSDFPGGLLGIHQQRGA